jgi:hypothetical protein
MTQVWSMNNCFGSISLTMIVQVLKTLFTNNFFLVRGSERDLIAIDGFSSNVTQTLCPTPAQKLSKTDWKPSREATTHPAAPVALAHTFSDFRAFSFKFPDTTWSVANEGTTNAIT